MLKETKPITQYSGEFRRLFQDDYFDLYLWYDSLSQNEIIGFQLCYDKHHRECALTWLRATGFSHHKVDSGDDSPKANRTPVLKTTNEVFPVEEIAARFGLSSGELEAEIAKFICEKLQEYS